MRWKLKAVELFLNYVCKIFIFFFLKNVVIRIIWYNKFFYNYNYTTYVRELRERNKLSIQYKQIIYY